MCPDEEGTETLKKLKGEGKDEFVEACAPMKRGLKHKKEVQIWCAAFRVEACAPMKRGLKRIITKPNTSIAAS